MNFEMENLVLIGSFNPAIIHADWLKEQKIYSRPITTSFNLPNGTFSHNLIDINIIFEINQNRIQISSSNLSANLTEKRLLFLVEIFKKLEYTPLFAIGYNLKSQASEGSINKIKLVKKDFDNGLDYFSITEKLKWNDYNLLINTELQIKPDLISILFNFEKRLDKKKIYISIEEFFKDFKKMRDYAITNC